MKTIEKAKRYDEAIEIARKIANGEPINVPDGTPIPVAIFPELAESDDKKIKREIIEYIKTGTYHKDWIVWLEKQAKKVEPIESFNSEFEKQISRLIASAINKEYEYTEAFIKWTSNAILNYAKHEIEQDEQKSAWSKEDTDMIETLVAIFEVNYPNDFYKVNPIGTTNMQAIHSSEIIKWLNSLKERVQSQKIAYYNPYKEIVESIAEMCKHYDKETDLQDFYDNVKVKCKDAKEYDSLFPQNRWKPSNEQMQALSNAGNSFRPFEEGHKVLWSLYNDLKKLREDMKKTYIKPQIEVKNCDTTELLCASRGGSFDPDAMP